MRLLFVLFIFMLGTVPQSSVPAEADEVLAPLSKIRLDKKQFYNIRDITIRRDALSIALNRGTIAFLEPVLGRVTGAVFIGSGEVVAIPPDAIEKQELYKFTGSPVLNEPFHAAMFRFTDNTYADIMKQFSQHAEETVSDDDAAQFLPLDRTVTDRSGLLNFRILADFLEPAGQELFWGEINGEKLGWFDVMYDQRLVEEVAVFKMHETGSSSTGDLWTSFNRRSEARNPEAAARENKARIDILSVDIDAGISEETQLDAQATMRFKGLVDGARVLSFDLSRSLRVKSVSLDSGEAVPFYQHPNITEQEIQRYGVNTFVVVLPRALRAGQEIILRFAYAGDALERTPNGVFYVGGRGLWYPNVGPQDTATFNLIFHYSTAYTLVATGSKVREWDEAGRRHAVWKSDGEFPIAGFNVGDFAIVADESAPVPLYTGVGATSETRVAAENLLKEVRETMKYFSEMLGPYPYQRLTVSQFPVRFSQGWPTILNVPLDSPSTEFVRASEIARQWLGNKVSWSSYHDQWILTGLASYAGAMYIEHKYPDTPRFREILNDARSYLTDRASDGKTNESAGPIWLGQRLASSLTPQGYSQTMFKKSMWVLHMLRMLMRDDGPNPDATFFEMTREFFQSYKGTVASTYDFKRVAEKYMTKAMDLRDDRKLDWFFDEWVFGTGFPAYRIDYKIASSQNGFTIEGTIKQSDVSETFVMPISVYADTDFLGRVVVGDEEGHFRFTVRKKPEQVLIDPYAAVLAKVN